MDVASLNLHHGSYLVELKTRKLLHGTCTIEGTSWNLHHGSFPHGTYTMDHGSYLMELTP